MKKQGRNGQKDVIFAKNMTDQQINNDGKDFDKQKPERRFDYEF